MGVAGPADFGLRPDAAAHSLEEEVQTLKSQAGYLESALAEIKKRIAELESTSEVTD
jgi:prefoldin subunit 5